MAGSKRSLIVALAILVACFMSMPLWLENWRRDLTENSARFDDESADLSLTPPLISKPVDQVEEQLKQWADSAPNWNFESSSADGDSIAIHLTHQTRVVRFVDDIRVSLRTVAGQTRVDAVSSSRFGVGDLGQNPRNLRELREGLMGN